MQDNRKKATDCVRFYDEYIIARLGSIKTAVNNNANYPYNNTYNIKHENKWTNFIYSITEINKNADYRNN